MTHPTLLLVEEHEPECGDFPVITIGSAWTTAGARAIIRDRIADQAPQHPGKTYQPHEDDANPDDEPDAGFDVWYEVHTVDIPADVPPVILAMFRPMPTCAGCLSVIEQDDHGAWIDADGGDGCGASVHAPAPQEEAQTGPCDDCQRSHGPHYTGCSCS